MIFIYGILLALLFALILLVIYLPAKVEYVESIVIQAPRSDVYDAIRKQEVLMQWSAWPEETNSLCEVNNEDGVLGAQTVYMNQKGKQFGYQEVIELRKDERVKFYLKSFVAPFEEDVKMTFLLIDHPQGGTEVLLWFDETLKKPLFLIAYFGNILKWVRSMHRKDLIALKKYVEANAAT